MKKFSYIVLADVLAFSAFVFLTTSGILLHYLLPPGSGRFRTIWGLDRHEWGDIHFWIAVIFFIILSFHLLLHKRWIVNVIKGREKKYYTPRLALGLVGFFALCALAVSPLLSPVTQESNYPINNEDIHINGSMTLNEIECITGVPADYIIQQLKLPSSVNKDQRLGQIRRHYGFGMKKIRRIVQDHKKKK